MAAASAVTEAWGTWIAELQDWHLFGGLTFDQRRWTVPEVHGKWADRRVEYANATSGVVTPRVSPDKARRVVLRWLTECEQVVGGRIDYVIALEYQKNGWPHFHPLLHLPNGLKDGQISALGGAWWRLAGSNRLEAPLCTEATARYAAKYLAKDFETGDVMLSDRASLGSGSVGADSELIWIKTSRGLQMVRQFKNGEYGNG